MESLTWPDRIFFSAAQIFTIVSGQGSTYDGSGLGNLIIGYNEFPNDAGPTGPHQRIGAHNLVIGRGIGIRVMVAWSQVS
jgi:hypothetical protein